MPIENHNGAPTYQGEVMLLGWSENNRDGMTVRLALDGTDEGDTHPFRGLGTGKYGQRFMAVLVPVTDEGEAIAADAPEKPRQSWAEMPRTKQAAIRCGETRFQDWLANEYITLWTDAVFEGAAGCTDLEITAQVVRRICGVKSRRDLDNAHHAKLWDDLETQYRVDTGQIPERTR